ncbi:M56 family metallopeptidase [Chryseobacterium sp. FH1]|uniref:M56 family metallopeptidase n=1 Tax=Chryseobacterium sp. FH1 TaxID=1233951 RepID=UPI00068B71A5|nr:M56 family metallopeptidase [Chryseobacterium sp. FH1]
METVIFKVILCSSLLIAIYYLFLQREKMFRFNRFYLLVALVFSYAIPFVKISLPAVREQKNQLVFEEIQTQQLIQNSSQISEFNWLNLILIIYSLVTFILIIKALISIFKIINQKGIDLVYENQNIKLIEKNLPPFSFWNKIYLNKTHFENQKIDNWIFLHEKTHLIQKHSLDLIFVEFLKAVSWFNPAIYLYKKAITDNHEFLADEVIISKEFNVRDYQKLILAEVLQVQNLSLINPFNFNNTKQRFIMMTTKKSKLENLKKIFAVSVIAVSSFFFVQKVYASGNTKNDLLNPEFQIDNSLKTDTVVVVKDFKNENSKVKKSKKYNSKKQFEDHELPIPPPPPPAVNFSNAEFPEGLNDLRKGIADAFDSSFIGKDEKVTMKTMLYVTINKYGEAVEVKPDGAHQKFNEEAVKAFRAATKGKIWKPATEEGNPTATVFQLPITMQFQ